MIHTENINRIYEEHKQTQQKLASMLNVIFQGQKSLDFMQDAEDSARLIEVVMRETFKILIIGEFNTGKSTLINALFGEEILPTKAIPATAIINEIRYGETRSAKLHFREKDKAPIEIPIDKLNEYVLIKNTDVDSAKEEIRESPFSHVEILWPLDLCKNNNVEIIDSPGLNEDQVREDVTMGYVKKVDAVLFIMPATRFGPAQSEMKTIKLLEAAEHKDLFFVINQWDMLRPSQQEEVSSTALKTLKKLTTRKDDIYFVSALDALEGRIENDPVKVSSSNFLQLEESLHGFLARDKGKIKVIRGSREVRRVIRKMLDEALPTKVNLLKTPLGELKLKYEATKKELNVLEGKKNEMLGFISRQKEQISELAYNKVKSFFYDVDQQVEGWAASYKINVKSINVKRDVNASIRELSNLLTENLGDSFYTWQEEDLKPFVKVRMDGLYRELEIRANDFEERLTSAQFTLNGANIESNLQIQDGLGPKNPLERILAAAGGFFIGGIGSGAIGAIFGVEEMLKSLLPNIAVGVLALIIGGPFLAIPALIAVATFQGKGVIEAKLKKMVIEKFKETLQNSKDDQAKQIADKIKEQLNDLQKSLSKGMDRQINGVKEQAEAALKNHQNGENEVNQKLAMIDEYSAKLRNINNELDELIEKLVNQK